LNGIINSAGTIKNIGEEIEPDLLMELTDDILVSARRLQRITENFLFYAQIEAASNSTKLIEQLRSFKTDEPAAMAYDIAPLKAQKYNRYNDIVVNAEVTDFYINLSSQHYGKVLDELLDNAFKFSVEGTPVEVTAWLKDNSFHLKISDKGIGMSQEEINSIAPFAQFGRFENEQQGIGLGLIIAKRTVELHGGYMMIKSEKGVGTSVEISIPAVMYTD
jgi:two-component system sensor histidine kinase/response regulator